MSAHFPHTKLHKSATVETAATLPAHSHKSSRNWAILLICAALLLILLSGSVLWAQSQLSSAKKNLQAYVQAALTGDDQAAVLAQELLARAAQVLTVSSSASTLLPSFIQATLPAPAQVLLTEHARLQQVLEFGPEILGISDQSPKRYILLFQNSEELRATGGFLGSYALLEVSRGKVASLQVQDIYEPDGQFTSFLPPPPGVKEYLSSGNGLRLPDANWHPDVPESMKDVLPFFTFGKTYQIDGVILINPQLVEELLRLTGPIKSPDLEESVTAESLSEVARADREHFFPGSIQKKHTLQLMVNALKQSLIQNPSLFASPEFLAFLHDQFTQKNVQFFSSVPQLQAVLTSLQVTGTVKECSELSHCISLMLIESNVGINKINPSIHRTVQIEQLDAHTSSIRIDFHNTATPLPLESGTGESREYINYQRLLTSPNLSVSEVRINDKKVDSLDQNTTQLSSKNTLLQSGFLVGVPPQSRTQVEILLHSTIPLPEVTTLVLGYQSGLTPSEYSITLPNIQRTLLLDQDMTLQAE